MTRASGILRSTRTKSARREQGSGILAALLVLSLVTLMGLSLTYNSMVENTISRNHETRAQAFFTAEAGLAHALEIVLKSGNLNAILAGADGLKLLTEDNGVLAGSLVPTGYSPIPATGVNYSGGRYEVRVYDDDYNASVGLLSDYAWTSQISLSLPTSDPRYGLREDGDLYFDLNKRVIIRATGYAPNGSVAVVEAMVGPGSAPAILTQENLTINGNPSITGPGGSVHTNTDLTISGNPTVSQNATASGTLSVSGSPTVGGTLSGGQPAIDIPNLYAADYQSQADYLLKADGKVYTGAGVFLFDTSSGTEYNGWKRSNSSPVVWTLSGNTGFPGVYYIEGSAKISGNPGDATTPVLMTILATGSIEISGNPSLRAKLTDILFLADFDVKISGNPAQNYRDGVIYAGEQIGLSGNPNITGNLVAKGRGNVSTLVDYNYVSGNPSVSWSGNSSLFRGVISWREVRG